MPLTAGTRLGVYEVIALLGSGGMGDVYRARDTRLSRDVAIKILPDQFARDADRRARFEREAQTVASLSHPNIVNVFDTGSREETLYLVMELLDGETLRARLTRDAALPVKKSTDYGVQMARGLAAAHDKGLVHRDLKPENVYLLFVPVLAHVVGAIPYPSRPVPLRTVVPARPPSRRVAIASARRRQLGISYPRRARGEEGNWGELFGSGVAVRALFRSV